jgi:G protein-coupled receptor Mth (Methuselah protein)
MCHPNCRFKVILSLFLLMGVPWTTEIITFLAKASFESALVTDIFNIISPFFIFIIFVCKPSVWKMFKLKFPRLNPLISACEKIGSRIIPSRKRNRHQPASAEESCNSNMTGSSSNNKTSQQTLTSESTDSKQVFELPLTRLP